MEILIKAAQLLLSLSILIVLHELGHFLPARFFGTRVEKFYLFFDWKFSLLKWKKGETEYGIGWIPLGGYVKISGMIDESMDKEQLAKPAEPWEFRAKPAWQRLIIMVGGVTVNLILGFIIYSMILFVWGTEKLPLKNAVYGVHCDSLLAANGFQDGDKILMVGNQVPYDLVEFKKLILLSDHSSVTVNREGATMVIDLPEDFVQIVLENNPKGDLVAARFPAVVQGFMKGYNAEKTALKPGDKVLAVNGEKALFFHDVRKQLAGLDGKTANILVKSVSGDTSTIAVKPADDGLYGIYFENDPSKFLETVTTEYSFFESIPAGVSYGFTKLSEYVSSFKLLFSEAGAQQLGGFGAIGSMFAPQWDWYSFWVMTAFLSVALAFMNILPIPALDGGHVIFLLWEMIAGKPAPEKVMEYAQYVGMVLLFGLMLFANGNDIFKAFFK